MSKANRPAQGVVMLLVTLLVVILIGCGGSGGSGGGGGTVTTGGGNTTTGTTGSAGQGTALYVLQWPVQTRGIPPYALSVVVSVYTFDTHQIVAQQTVNRSGTAAYNQTLTFKLPAGKYSVTVDVKPNLNGGGDTIATDTVTTTVSENQTVSTTLTFTNLVAKMFIDDLPSQASIGQTIQVHAHAEDSDGNAILLPPAALDWTITSGSNFATITSSGQLTLLATGTVTIQVREIDTNATASKSITLVQGSTNGVIVIVS